MDLSAKIQKLRKELGLTQEQFEEQLFVSRTAVSKWETGTHIDKGHIHNHIYYNSTAQDCSRKFHNFIGSSFAVRRLSDRVCIEH